MPLARWQFLLVSALAGLALILSVINILLQSSNSALQTEVNQGQRFINQSIQISQLNNQLINSLAQYAAQANDAAITELLNANGVTFSLNADPAPAADAPADEAPATETPAPDAPAADAPAADSEPSRQ